MMASRKVAVGVTVAALVSVSAAVAREQLQVNQGEGSVIGRMHDGDSTGALAESEFVSPVVFPGFNDDPPTGAEVGGSCLAVAVTFAERDACFAIAAAVDLDRNEDGFIDQPVGDNPFGRLKVNKVAGKDGYSRRKFGETLTRLLNSRGYGEGIALLLHPLPGGSATQGVFIPNIRYRVRYGVFETGGSDHGLTEVNGLVYRGVRRVVGTGGVPDSQLVAARTISATNFPAVAQPASNFSTVPATPYVVSGGFRVVEEPSHRTLQLGSYMGAAYNDAQTTAIGVQDLDSGLVEVRGGALVFPGVEATVRVSGQDTTVKIPLVHAESDEDLTLDVDTLRMDNNNNLNNGGQNPATPNSCRFALCGIFSELVGKSFVLWFGRGGDVSSYANVIDYRGGLRGTGREDSVPPVDPTSTGPKFFLPLNVVSMVKETSGSELAKRYAFFIGGGTKCRIGESRGVLDLAFEFKDSVRSGTVAVETGGRFEILCANKYGGNRRVRQKDVRLGEFDDSPGLAIEVPAESPTWF